MTNPYMVMKKDDGTVAFLGQLKSLKLLKEATAAVKKSVKAKTKAKKAKAVKKKKVVPKPDPPRPSPFEMNDQVWVQRAVGDWAPAKITKLHKPEPTFKEWSYTVEGDHKLLNEGYISVEKDLIPASVFTLMANDVVKMKQAEIGTELNTQFDGNAIILGAYRQGQKKPWCFYVFPDPDLICHNITFKAKSAWYSEVEQQGRVQKVPSNRCRLRLIPISSAPQELLTYLGIYIYGRKWVRQLEGI